jgi:hypothetical protein
MALLLEETVTFRLFNRHTTKQLLLMVALTSTQERVLYTACNEKPLFVYVAVHGYPCDMGGAHMRPTAL